MLWWLSGGRALTGRVFTEHGMPYDPMRPPAGPEWTGLDEGEQIALVSDFHRSARIKMANLEVHAAMHVAVENQALMGDETPVAAALARLTVDGHFVSVSCARNRSGSGSVREGAYALARFTLQSKVYPMQG